MTAIRTIDLAHPPRRPDEVESALTEEWGRMRNSSDERILKIIHGYGSSGKGGNTRNTVRNWLFSKRGRFQAILAGEECLPTNPLVETIVKEILPDNDPDLLRQNPGVTFVWVK
jgi:hypothetical protein